VSFFDGIGRKLSDAGQKTIKKTKELSDSARLNMLIAEEEKKLDVIYCQIGKLYISLHGDTPENDFDTLITSLREIEDKVNVLKAQLHDLKGLSRCPGCGAEVPMSSAFCSVCGTPMPTPQPVENPDFKRCPQCGAMVKREMRFCTQCGAPFADVPAPAVPVSDMPQTPLPDPQPARSQNAPTALETGTPLTLVCPQCGTVVKMGTRFCTQGDL